MRVTVGNVSYPTFVQKDKSYSNMEVDNTMSAQRLLGRGVFAETVSAENATICGVLTVKCMSAEAIKAPCIFGVETLTPNQASGVITVHGEVQATVLSATDMVETQELHLQGNDGKTYKMTIDVVGGDPGIQLAEVDA